MSFKKVLGQDQATHTFQRILKKGRLSHAYIFLGIDGVGRSLFARQLAKGLNCAVIDTDSCDRCISCRKIDAGTAPDVLWISLEKGRKFLGIQDMKALQDSAALKPVESNHKIFIIQDANKLSEEASNCLLKTLEEPPPSTLIILLVNSLDSLPETIVSRCQIIRFLNLQKDVILSLLKDHYKGNIEYIEWLAHISNGSIGNAITLIEEDLYKKNDALINSLFSLKIIDNFRLSQKIHDWLPESKKTLEEKRGYLKIILDLILYYYRDILICKTKPPAELHYFNSKHKDLIVNQNHLFSLDEIMKIIDQIITAVSNLESNANTNLLFENLLTRIAIVTEKHVTS